jgi:putative glutamine amidotransferase
LAQNLPSVKIGLSYDAGSAKYRLYAGALLAAAEQANIEVQPIWLAGTDRPTNRQVLETIDGLILTGGADVAPSRYGFADPDAVCEITPGRDDVEYEILRAALLRRLPMLAICRGMQLLNVFQGGSLVPHLATVQAHRLEDRERHDVALEGGSALSVLLGRRDGQVTSSHHQAVDRPGNGLCVAARHADGTIEAIEWISPMRKPWLAAVQWHPERMGLDEPFAGPLYRGFLQAVAVSHALV